VGPGDPELVTAKAIRLIQQANLVICPVKKKGAGSTAYEIVKEYAKDRKDDVQFMVFPMVGGTKDWEGSWIENAEAIGQAWRQGKEIAFLTLGDPSIYSTWAYLQPYLPDEMDREVVPGIPSFCAVSARLGRHLTLGDENLALLGHVNRQILEDAESWADTLVVMKPKRNTGDLKSWLEKEALANTWALVSECGKEKEKIIEGDLDQLDKNLPYFSTMIIRRRDGNE
jgi:precorrin-2/cobalt-factor-2 C20-methyltransferase